MITVIDRYKLNLYCICLDCEKKSYDGKAAHSCQAYPKRNGIPPKIWNTENAKCEYFEPNNSLQDDQI